jgi:Protein of unknown function (DUF1565)
VVNGRGQRLGSGALVAVTMMLVGGCDAVLGIGDYHDRGDEPGVGEDGGPAPEGGPIDPDGGPIGDEAGKDGATPGPGGSIDFGPVPDGGPTLSTLTCPVLAMPALVGTVYVDANATGAEAGTKAAPFHTIAKAFASAAPKSIIWVAAGTYKETLVIPDKLLLVQGGFAPGFAARTNACATILEPAAPSQKVLTANGVRGFAMEGMSVQKGARGLDVTGDDAIPASFTVARCVFSENGKTTDVGGGVILASVTARIFGSVFRDNRASKGAAVASFSNRLTMDQNLFDRNLGYDDHGGGLYLSPKSASITRNTFRANKTAVGLVVGKGGWGGGVIVFGTAAYKATADFSFNVFTENVAYIGGALFADDGSTVTMSHDLIYRNRAYSVNGALRAAALYVDGTGDPGGGSTFTAEYLTVANNNYDENGQLGTPSFGGNVYVEQGSKATFTNSIFWNNGDNPFFVDLSSSSSITVNNTIGMTGCTSADNSGFIPASATLCKIGAGVFVPAAIYFVDEANDDYHEKSTGGHYTKGGWVTDTVTSPAIDKADPAASVGSEPAPNGGRANLGVYARTKEASKAP